MGQSILEAMRKSPLGYLTEHFGRNLVDELDNRILAKVQTYVDAALRAYVMYRFIQTGEVPQGYTAEDLKQLSVRNAGRS